MTSVEILIEGYLDEKWGEWLGEIALTHPQPDQTLLAGQVKDQAALYGLIASLRDLGVRLISINYTES
jgi:hypothetical protein